MALKDNIQFAINDQIQAEFESAYLYLAMSGYMEAQGFQGFGHWLRIQWQEETMHAMKFFDFLLRRGGKVELRPIAAAKPNFGTPLQVFESVLQHEQHITSRIHRLYSLAVSEKDYALQSLLHWFIDEQVEEEDNAGQIIDKLRLIGDSGSNLYLLDQELKQRVLETAGAGSA